MQAILLALVVAWAAAEERPVEISPARTSEGIHVHGVTSPYQPGVTLLRVLTPDHLNSARRYPVIYVLPVEAGSEGVYGDGLIEARSHDLHNRHQVIFASPTFAHLPWYADHSSADYSRQESYFLRAIVPAVEVRYPALLEPRGRFLLGFSKSGWGAWSLMLRNGEKFARAASWDAPLMMDEPGDYGSGPIFGTEENFRRYQISKLLKEHAAEFAANKRLILLGHGGFREDTERAHALLDELKIPHDYRDGPKRKHDWHSGWLKEAVELLLAE